ncbi:hypothetical protein K432DRAFT_383242 [Lepidopterella palustris CBS 459.81]|uniref:Uncharacterized protein n=1 Tax=Lepidopterella palustris CBS 459.81 TaxID=1314670 RepID=A0A8E2E8E3_9PEZI|nr:hypothetical protein K432DRAFT_383242 [Lepidopterella palustris CBS 459.81]
MPAQASDDGLTNDSYPESSPDPLSMSYSASRPISTRPVSKKPRKAPLAPSSANTQQQQTSYNIPSSDFPSPTKSMTMHTGRSGGVSPWKIKVTVEAEPEMDGSGEENVGYSLPTPGLTTHTTTRTVPVKDYDGSSPVKRRGRPRKSDASFVTKPTRSGTPVQRKSRGQKSSIGIAEDSIPDILTESGTAPPKRGRGRPRKSVQSETDVDKTAIVDNAAKAVEVEQPALPNTAVHNSTLNANSSKRAILDFANLTPLHKKHPIVVQEETSNGPTETPWCTRRIRDRVPTPIKPIGPSNDPLLVCQVRGKSRQILEQEQNPQHQNSTTASNSIKERKGTPARPAEGSRCQPASPSSQGNEVQDTPSGSEEDNDADMWRAMVERQEEDQINNGEANIGNKEQRYVDEFGEDEIPDEDTIYNVDDEGRTLSLVEQDTTILESENFSMISIDSLPSIQTMGSPAIQQPIIDLTGRDSDRVTDTFTRNTPAQLYTHHETSSLLSPPPMPSTGLTPSNIRSSPPMALHWQQTPSMSYASPSIPPAIEIPHISPGKAPTPKLARVVKAGIALQGVLDPDTETSTEEPCNGSNQKQKSRLDSLFSGFGEGTRRELQAGLRLGEQMAQLRSTSKEPLSAIERPPRIPQINISEGDVFNGPRGSQEDHDEHTRLPTPQEKDDYVLAVPPPPSQNAVIEYPSLSSHLEQIQLVSPARSVDEMSWQADTPPSTKGGVSDEGEAASSKTVHTIQESSVLSTNVNDQKVDYHLQRQREAVSRQVKSADLSKVIVIDEDEEEKEDYSDIWEEEAGRSSESLPSVHAAPTEYGEKSPQLRDLFADNNTSLLKPTRGKIPKTWRRKSSSNFSYSDEAEPELEDHSSAQIAEQRRSIPVENDNGKMQSSEREVRDEDEESSESSDDTGVFWQNLPSVYNKTNSSDPKSTKLDLSMVLGINDTPMNNSQLNTPQKFSPFKNVPIKMAPLQVSYNGSPFKQQLASPDIETGRSFDKCIDNSELDYISPSHSGVDDTESSDVRQLREEMESRPYESRNPILHDIGEVTEQSEQHARIAEILSSPPQTLETSVLAPGRVYTPLFAKSNAPVTEAFTKPTTITNTSDVDPAKPQPSGLFSRLASTLWSAIAPAAAPPPHPLTSKYDPLPRVEPWTKTHYKTLDALFQHHKRNPSTFVPGNPPNTNNALLAAFTHRAKFLGAKYSCWGYSVVIEEVHLVIAAVFMQLLTLRDVEEYERVSGRAIERGDVNPKEEGLEISDETVVRRLFTVIAGEDLRRDERRGVVVKREVGLAIEWPN